MKYKVKEGHSVVTDKTYLPGEDVELSDADAKRLIKQGIVAKPKDPAKKVESGNQKPSVEQRIQLVKAAATIEELDKLADGETAKTVKAAIEEHRKELTAE